MKKIGFIKWYGGEKRQSHFDDAYENINYGFIESQDGQNIFVHKNDLITNEFDLYEGVIVTFELQLDKKKGVNSV